MEKTEEPRPTSRNALATLVVVIVVGLLGITLYALQSQSLTQFFSIVAVGITIAGAFLLGGGTLGFLFGIPRTRLEGGEKERYEPNTNIEQISDWLTKIIVGVGLTQITKVPGALEQLSTKIAPGLGGFVSSPIFGAAIILFFSLCGFLFGWLWTRLFLTGAIKESEEADKKFNIKRQESSELYTKEIEETGEKKKEIQEKRLEVERDLAYIVQDSRQAQQRLRQLALEYENLRDTMPSSPTRTSKMSELVAEVRALALRVDYKPEMIIDMFNKGTPGYRIVALGLIQAKPSPELFDVVLQGISPSKSAFEQYNALRAAVDMVPFLNDDQKRKLMETIGAERQAGNIQPQTDRDDLGKRIEQAIGLATT